MNLNKHTKFIQPHQEATETLVRIHGDEFEFKNNLGNVLLNKWCSERYGRTAAIARQLYPRRDDLRGRQHSLHHYKTGRFPVHTHNLPIILEAMKIVESKEI